MGRSMRFVRALQAEDSFVVIPIIAQLDSLDVNYVLCGVIKFAHWTQCTVAPPTLPSFKYISGNNTHAVTVSACPLTPMEKSDSSKSTNYF